MQNEIIRLSIRFFEEVKQFGKDSHGMVKTSNHYKMTVMKSIELMIGGGMRVEELDSLITRFINECPTYQEAYSMDDIVHFYGLAIKKSEIARDPNNLLESGKFYYHPKLQILPPPPTIEFLPDGSFQSSYQEEPFFLEIKDCFTLDDLVDYFYQTMEIKKVLSRERDKGAFKHLLERYRDLDLLLFTITEAKLVAEDTNQRRPQQPFDIENFIEYGHYIYEEKKNSAYEGGLDRVIPRAR